jgi:hypothetical protein
VPADHFVDRRNDEPIERLSERSTSTAYLGLVFDEADVEIEAAQMPYLPELYLRPPSFEQPYHLELWCEKTTVNDVLLSLANRYEVNVVAGAGELSLTACVKLVERAEQSERPVRILYVSDFDPAGQSMPVAVARKIEHRLRSNQLDHLDIQVRPVALTFEQCQRYRLPRTPIKDTDRRKNGFEERHGEGATELDALEALHSGELRRILEAEIERYHDATLDQRVRDVAREIQKDIVAINDDVHARHGANIDALTAEWDAIQAEYAQRLDDWRELAEPVWHAIASNLRANSPDIDEIEWPEAEEADEDDDPLFDSTRDYVEQINRYKEFQGKPTARRGCNGGET